MDNRLKKYVAPLNSSIKETLQIIDANKKGFALITDEDCLVGVATGGDIRWALLRGSDFDSTIASVCKRSAKTLTTKQTLVDAIDLFKSEAISFLPVVDERRTLKNVITKKQLYSVLLTDRNADLLFNFDSLDETLVDHEVFSRLWGFYKTTVMNDYFQSKMITVNPGGQLSLQSHNRREEHWIVAHGNGNAQLGDSIIDVCPGSTLFIPK